MKVLIRKITPKKLNSINAEYFLGEFRDALGGEVKNQIIRDFQKTVNGWKKPPRFWYALVTTSREMSVQVFPTGPNANKYLWVNDGVKGRIIRPKNGRALSFRTGYKPATRPMVIGSGKFSRSGKLIARTFVRWPGIKARNFDKAIAKKYKAEFQRTMQNALNRAARRLR